MKKYVVALVAGAFITVLLLNTYFNLTSNITINKDGKTLEDKFYLAGPDPYYNMRLLQVTLKTGHFPFMGGAHGEKDPLLNYPLGGSGGRPPLFTMLAIGFGKLLSIFIDEQDAMGYAMQFLPALYGALIVIPVYFIGRIIFNRKVGIIAAWIVPLIPIHLSSGHGSAYSLYDTDSAILLCVTTSLMFLMMALKEKNVKKSIILSALSGVFAAAITMIWVASQYIYGLIAVYAIVQMVMDIFANKINIHIVRSSLISLFTGYLLSFPVLWIKHGFTLTLHLAAPIAVGIFSILYLWIGKKNIPWIVSLPSIFGVAGIGLAFLYLIRNTTNKFLMPLQGVSNIIFGSGIYGKKVSLTIAEASTFGFSRTVMSFGPVIYWLGWLGFFYLLYKYFYKKGWQKEYMVIIVWFAIEAWLVHTAGRFLNDMVPLMAILGGATTWLIIKKLDFKEMMKNLRGLGGGWYGIKKSVKLRHVFGVIFITFFIIFPNGWLSFDASIPSTMKRKFHTDKLGAFGLGVHTEKYWQDALSWLRKQNSNYSDEKKPAFISWWDYGFYCVAIAKNPTVADNFQEGIPAAANFQTAGSEKEAVTVLIVRLIQGYMKKYDGKIGEDLKALFEKYLGENETTNLTNILEDPREYAPSYGEIISKEYGGKKYKVREENAMYHDATNILMKLDDENLTMLYREIQNLTGYSIRYYGVEGYDINIFNVFVFLSDKGTYGYETTEDDYFKLWYIANKTKEKLSPDEVENITKTMSRDQISDIYGTFTPYTQRKDKFYRSMTYRVYLGDVPRSIFENYSTSFQLAYYFNPTGGLKHFYAKYISPVTKEKALYYVPRPGRLCTGLPAVVIAKYYEGAKINGIVESEGVAIEGATIEVLQNASIFGMNRPIGHDKEIVGSDGKFSVIAPAGKIALGIYNGAGVNRVELKKIYMNISEEQAERISNWKIDLGKINIPRGNIKGIVYWDKDGDGEYNASIDKKIDAKIKIGDKEVRSYNGKYEMKHLIPAIYKITAEKRGYDITNEGNIKIHPNSTTWYNISFVLSKVEVKGRVWYDENKNGRIDRNESIASAPVEFNIISAPDKNAENESAYTNATGYYTARLSPGKYDVIVNSTIRKGNETVHYVYKGTLNIRIGEISRTYNIKLRKE